MGDTEEGEWRKDKRRRQEGEELLWTNAGPRLKARRTQNARSTTQHAQRNITTCMAVDPPRVFSIQSWVCHGYVGNKCSVFALQALGIEVDPLNTVQFSNHTGYPKFAGQVLTGDEVWTVFEGLTVNNLANYSHLLTGYSKSPSSLRTLVKIRQKLRELNPNIIHFCDPVMGDNGKLYVSEELVEIYKKEVIPGADFLKPNQTECEYLTGIKIQTEKDALEAIDVLHSWGVKNIVVSSLNFNPVICSTCKTIDNSHERFKIQVPKLPEDVNPYTGTGDLFSALLLGWSIQSNNFREACEKAVATLQAVLRKTYQERLLGHGNELQLVKSRKEIENPVVLLHAEKI